jgi:hypothetical protein
MGQVGVCGEVGWGKLGQTPKSGAKSPLDPGQPQTRLATENWQVRGFTKLGQEVGGGTFVLRVLWRFVCASPSHRCPRGRHSRKMARAPSYSL